MKMSEALTPFFKNVLIGVLATLCAVLLVAVAYLFLTKDRTVASDDSLREELVPVAEMTTYEYRFTQVLFLSDSGNPLNINNLITTKRYVATIDGSVPIQIDAAQLTCEGSYGMDGALDRLTVRLPHSSIGEVALFHDTAKKYVEDNGFLNLNQVSTEDSNGLYVQVEETQRAKLAESDVIERADERAKYLIRSQMQHVHGKDVEVEFEFFDGRASE